MTDVLSSDLDGTIVHGDGIHDEDVSALHRWVGAGSRLVLNTGRSLGAIATLWSSADLPRPDAVVAFTGAVIADGDMEVITSTPHEPGLFDEVLGVLDGEAVRVHASTIDGDHLVVDAVASSGSIALTDQVATPADLSGAELYGIPVHIPDHDDMARLQTALEKVCRGRAEIHRNLDYLDIVPLGATKGEGLAAVLRRWPDHGAVISVGDSWNDVPMHEKADLSAAMSTAEPDLQHRCDVVVASVAELVSRVLG